MRLIILPSKFYILRQVTVTVAGSQTMVKSDDVYQDVLNS